VGPDREVERLPDGLKLFEVCTGSPFHAPKPRKLPLPERALLNLGLYAFVDYV
jgi:hypothetical protein